VPYEIDKLPVTLCIIRWPAFVSRWKS